jgi:hypothetical protein
MTVNIGLPVLQLNMHYIPPPHADGVFSRACRGFPLADDVFSRVMDVINRRWAFGHK